MEQAISGHRPARFPGIGYGAIEVTGSGDGEAVQLDIDDGAYESASVVLAARDLDALVAAMYERAGVGRVAVTRLPEGHAKRPGPRSPVSALWGVPEKERCATRDATIARNSLMRNGITTVGKLTAMTPGQVRRLKWFGDVSMVEVLRVLDAHGLALKHAGSPKAPASPVPRAGDAGIDGEQVEVPSLPPAPGDPPPNARGTSGPPPAPPGGGPAQVPSPLPAHPGDGEGQVPGDGEEGSWPSPGRDPGSAGNAVSALPGQAGGSGDARTSASPPGDQLASLQAAAADLRHTQRNRRGARSATPKGPRPGMTRYWPGGGGAA